ncbi:hypothetical protein [Pseudotabrizicola sp.]|uniref:hypothetical protein n=1 Tax=Pseudotabrizicola sp. TaxID=2939647 RepID=UPI00272F1705|nr:hypothetical protein [Pseudotabrizicola sp.]
MFRIDVDFDPTVDPVTLVEESYIHPAGAAVNLRKSYEQKSGFHFTAPLMAFQRPTGRFEEHHLFAAAKHQLAIFCDQMEERMPSATQTQIQAKDAEIARIKYRIERINEIHERYFNVHNSERDHRMPFSGIMTRDVYTKAAHFHVLREQLPAGFITLVTEQEAILPSVLPHVFREEIQKDSFRWIAMTFDKNATKPEMENRVSTYKAELKRFIEALRASDPVAEATMTNGERMRAFIAATMKPAIGTDGAGNPRPVQSHNFQQSFMPMIWIASPLQTAGETNKIVGFPLMRSKRRTELKALPFDAEIANPDTRAAVAYHVWSATLQPVSTFFNSIRERISFARRAGGKAARSGPSYINGAAFNPRVLIALLNIFRIHYNYFEPRQYMAPWLENGGIANMPQGEIEKRIPGTDTFVPFKKKKVARPLMRTPAMRLGIQDVNHDRDGNLKEASIHRVLYRPWIFWGTPVWDKFENRKVDRRTLKRAT